jgi:hypothetical protein
MPGKRVHLDTVVLEAVELLGTDEGKSFQELVDEAFADLLKKHHRPVGLHDALRQSLRRLPANANARKRH